MSSGALCDHLLTSAGTADCLADFSLICAGGVCVGRVCRGEGDM